MRPQPAPACCRHCPAARHAQHPCAPAHARPPVRCPPCARLQALVTWTPHMQRALRAAAAERQPLCPQRRSRSAVSRTACPAGHCAAALGHRPVGCRAAPLGCRLAGHHAAALKLLHDDTWPRGCNGGDAGCQAGQGRPELGPGRPKPGPAARAARSLAPLASPPPATLPPAGGPRSPSWQRTTLPLHPSSSPPPAGRRPRLTQLQVHDAARHSLQPEAVPRRVHHLLAAQPRRAADEERRHALQGGALARARARARRARRVWRWGERCRWGAEREVKWQRAGA